MKSLFLISCLLAVCGCHKSAPAPLSPEFSKSGKFAYALLQQAEQGQPVLKADVSRALAEVQSLAANDDEKMAMYMLQAYRSDVEFQGMARMTADQTHSMAQTKCEIEKMFTQGMRGTEAMQACGEKLGG